MEQFTILVKEFTTKDGTRKFTTASVQGKYDIICDNVWIDKRKDFVDKNIVRVKGSISFNKK